MKNPEKKHKLQILYLTNEIDEKKWKYFLQRDEKGAAREKAKLQLIEMFIGAAQQIFNEVLTNSSFDPVKMIDELNNLMKFVNEQSQYLLKDYQNTTPGCDYNWFDHLWTIIPCKKEKKKSKKETVIRHIKGVHDDGYFSDTDEELSDSDDEPLKPLGGAGVS